MLIKLEIQKMTKNGHYKQFHKNLLESSKSRQKYKGKGVRRIKKSKKKLRNE